MRLRQLEEKDADGMLEWMRDPEISTNFSKRMDQLKKNDVIKFINNSSIVCQDGNSIHYAIVDDADEYLGTISLKDINLQNRHAEFAISLRKKAQGKGIASEAIQEVLKVAFEKHLLNKVFLNVLEENKRAIKLYERSGFIFEGKFRQHIMVNDEYKTLIWYGILRQDYQGEPAYIKKD
ncbi:MAG: GNAT family N-acetyltransferase [Lachnospiraceae bacterium]